MRATEIMISDYLSYKGQIIKVASITKKKVGYHIKDNEYRMHYARLCECKPIPITPEIFEKLGFVRNLYWHHFDRDYDNFSVCIQLGYANRIEYIKIAEKGKDNVIPSERTKLYLTHIKYLHQLQHALRLCGISIKIEL